MTYLDFKPIYDFTQIECGVQKFFVQTGPFVAPAGETDQARAQWTPPDALTPFYTPFENAVFQKCRPRISIAAVNFNAVPGMYAIDANGNMREKAWAGPIYFEIVTAPNYDFHRQFRAQVLAIIAQAITISVDGTAFAAGGVNAFLKYHQLSTFNVKNVSTTIRQEEGAYVSNLPIDTGFSVLPSAWPPGMQTY